MLRELTKQEIKEHNQMIDLWWKDLEEELKDRIYYFMNHILDIKSCTHMWSYGLTQDFLDNLKFCLKCKKIIQKEKD